jgi:predicted PurR-regulated permease PerM
MAIAALLAIATANLHILLIKILPPKIGLKNDFFVSLLLVFILGAILFGPIVYFITTLTSMINDFSKYVTILEKTKGFILENLDYIPSDLYPLKQKIRVFLHNFYTFKYTQDIITFMANIGKMSIIFLWDILLILTFYFFLGIYGADILSFVKRAAPLNEHEMKLIYREVSQVMGVVFYSSLVNAIFQGFLFGGMISFFGFDGIFFGVMYGFASLIPIVGGLIMWLPLSLFELSNGHINNAIIIALYSIVIISILADNFIKPIIISYINKFFVLNGEPQINSLLIFFSIIAGLGAYGFWGMILGPAITALFVSILKIYSLIKLNENKPTIVA